MYLCFLTFAEELKIALIETDATEPIILMSVFISLRFEYLGPDSQGNSVKGKRVLGLNFFLIDNNFLNR